VSLADEGPFFGDKTHVFFTGTDKDVPRDTLMKAGVRFVHRQSSQSMQDILKAMNRIKNVMNVESLLAALKPEAIDSLTESDLGNSSLVLLIVLPPSQFKCNLIRRSNGRDRTSNRSRSYQEKMNGEYIHQQFDMSRVQ